jgi:hypothetical protein
MYMNVHVFFSHTSATALDLYKDGKIANTETSTMTDIF